MRDVLRNPILSGDVIFTPRWQRGVQRYFCLLGILDIDADRKDDGEAMRNLLDSQNSAVEAEVDASGRASGKLTAATRYVVVGRRPLVTEDDVPRDAYDRMLTRAEELGIDQISVDKLLDYLQYRPKRVAASSNLSSGGPAFRPRTRPRTND